MVRVTLSACLNKGFSRLPDGGNDMQFNVFATRGPLD
jgi:hypothetical protein